MKNNLITKPELELLRDLLIKLEKSLEHKKKWQLAKNLWATLGDNEDRWLEVLQKATDIMEGFEDL